MANSVSWIAKIKIPEESYKRLLKSESVRHFAEIIETTLSKGLPNFFIFHYSSEDESLILMVYLHNNEAGALDGSIQWIPVDEIVRNSSGGTAGYLAGFTDAQTPDYSNIITAYRISDKNIEKIPSLPKKEWNGIIKSTSAIHRKAAEKNSFAEAFLEGLTVDPVIVEICSITADNRRLEKIGRELRTADFNHPVHLFDNYYHNGEICYYTDRKDNTVRVLKKTDISKLTRTVYGACDPNHAVYRGKEFDCTSSDFKVPVEKETELTTADRCGLYTVPEGMIHPPDMTKKGNLEQFCSKFIDWDRDHFSSVYSSVENRTDYELHQRIGKFLKACADLGRFDEIIEYFQKIKDYAWINPASYFSLACAHAQNGNTDRAIEAVYNTIVFAYDHCGQIFLDKRLSLLKADKRFSEFRKYFKSHANEIASPELLLEVLKIPPETLNFKRFATRLALRTHFFDVPKLEEASRKSENERFDCAYRDMLQKFFDNYFMLDEGAFDYGIMYAAYANHESLSPIAHYLVLRYSFIAAHNSDTSPDRSMQKIRFQDTLRAGKHLLVSLSNGRYKDRNDRINVQMKDDTFWNYIINNSILH